MTEELLQVYNRSIEKPLQILTIFNEFFGEDRVDLQGIPALPDIPARSRNVESINAYIRRNTPDIFILVHFPHVKVTNEFDKFTYVNHLYAKVSIDIEGRLKYKFSLNRAEYTVQHFTNNYMHSHVCCIPTDNFTEFQTPCTGSGPINNTICSLIHGYDEDLWRLFCLELDRFVQVESIAGTPYHRLEGLTDRRNSLYRLFPRINYQSFLTTHDLGRDVVTLPQIAKFIKYVVDNDVLKFTYVSGKYRLAMSPTNFLIAISNAFIKWYNKEFAHHNVTSTFRDLIDSNILRECKFINGQLWQVNQYNSGLLNYDRFAGEFICTFKGRDVRVSFSDAPRNDEETTTNTIILNERIAGYVATKILNVINFRYGNNTENPNEKGVYFI